MTARHAGYVVTLADDIREDDAEHIINALRMIRGVLSVEPVIADLRMSMAVERAKAQARDKLADMLRDLQ